VTIVLGVDGGGTGTHAILADDVANVLGFGMSGPSNWEDVGFEAASAAIKACVREAMSGSGVELGDVAYAVFGLAGVDFPSDEEKMIGLHAALGLGGACRMTNDSFVALRAGTNHPWGVVVIAGTGSVVAGRNPAGETFRTFGLGRLFGDDSSGTEISEDAVTAIAAQELGRGPHTSLAERFCELTGAASVTELLEGVARSRINERQFAPAVIEAAEHGDLVARRILERAGSSLGDLAGHVARRLSMQDSEFELVLAGSMFRTESRVLRAALEATVKRSARFAFPVTLEAPPVVGAALLAMEFEGLHPDREDHARLAVATISSLNRRAR
jgi:N-acetylglucosamine kinase-like BadF-type ATPase